MLCKWFLVALLSCTAAVRAADDAQKKDDQKKQAEPEKKSGSRSGIKSKSKTRTSRAAGSAKSERVSATEELNQRRISKPTVAAPQPVTAADSESKRVKQEKAIGKAIEAASGGKAEGAKGAQAAKAGESASAKKDGDKASGVTARPGAAASAAKKQGKPKSLMMKAIESALVSNRRLGMSASDVRRTHEDTVKAKAHFLPKIDGNVGYNHGQRHGTNKWGGGLNKDDSRRTDETKMQERNVHGGVRASYNLFRGGAHMAGSREADRIVRAKWSEYDQSKQEVVKNTIIRYVEVWAKAVEVSLLEALRTARAANVKTAKEMHESGGEKYLGVSQSVASLAETEAKLGKAVAELKHMRAKFEEFTGFTLPARLERPDPIMQNLTSYKQCLDIALRNNPEIIAATARLEAAKAALSRPNEALLPSVDASYSLDLSRDRGEHRRRTSRWEPIQPKTEEERKAVQEEGKDLGGEVKSEGYKVDKSEPNRHINNTVSLTMSWSIYDGGVARAERRQAAEAVTRATLERAEIIKKVETELEGQWGMKNAAGESVDSVQRAIEARKIALNDTLQEFNTGLKISSDVLQAQTDCFEAELAKARAEQEYFVAACLVLESMGHLRAEVLGFVDRTPDHKAEYARTRKKF